MKTITSTAVSAGGKIVTLIEVVCLQESVEVGAEQLSFTLTEIAKTDHEQFIVRTPQYHLNNVQRDRVVEPEREQEAAALRITADAYAQEIAEAKARGIALRTELFLRAVKAQEPSSPPSQPFEGLRLVMAYLGLLARALLHVREGKAEPRDAAELAVLLAVAVRSTLWSLGYFWECDKWTQDISDELVLARAKFPNNTLQLTALTEEVGDFSHALFNLSGIVDPDCVDASCVDAAYKEAVQATAMACRVATEGDSTLTYRPEEVAWLDMAGLL